MVLHWRQTGDEVAAWWVHDYHSRLWLRAENATFAHCRGSGTPMGFGMTAFKEAADAAAFASECGGETLAFQELLAHPLGGEGAVTPMSRTNGETHEQTNLYPVGFGGLCRLCPRGRGCPDDPATHHTPGRTHSRART
ncbi:nitrous oxide reductase accessory protein NosL [bacterium]|nr:nitrous oxide reductase accessory protein NosL [bacterium]